MAPTTRKRAAPPASDAEPASAPATKKVKRGADKQIDDADDQPATTTKSKAKTKSKKTTIQLSDDELDATPPKATRAKGKAKVKAINDDGDQEEDASATAAGAVKATKRTAKANRKAKVKADPEDEDDTKDDEPQAFASAADEPLPQMAKAQYAKSKDIRVPLDEACHMKSYSVHVDESTGIIYDASLNQTNAGNNNNKFYRIQLLKDGKDFKTWTRWGRVGANGQTKVLGDGSFQGAFKEFQAKFKDKTGLTWNQRGSDPIPKKYVFLERSYELDSDEEESGKYKGPAKVSRASPPKCTLAPQVKSLMELIFNQQYIEQAMEDLNYDSAKLPLGKLSKPTIMRGYQALKELAALFHDQALAQSKYEMVYYEAVEMLSNRYYSYIPHVFGMKRPPVIQDDYALKREVDLLDSLTDLKDADEIIKSEKDGAAPIHPLDSRFKGLGMQEMSPVDSSAEEFKEISQYLVKTCGETHAMEYQVRDVFRIERQGEIDRFEKSKFSKIKSDRRLLWHGSRATNYGGILSQGLRIAPPEAPVSGYMFGKGIYLADMSSKSANYCCSYISGDEALLLLCEAELGNQMQTLTDASYTAGEDAIEQGMWSTWGQGQTGPKAWKDAGCVHPSLAGVTMPDTTQMPGDTKVEDAYLQYNEYIAYDVAQVRLRYLLRVKVDSGLY